MSGHSKWSTIKRKKGILDQKRGQLFSKLSRVITVAVKEGGGLTDPANNIKLRLAVDRARAQNMPKENIERAIEKAKGSADSMVKEVVYEGFGPGGVALVIEAFTDNSNRTHGEVKNTLEKNGGKMGGHNSVLYQFIKCGMIVFEKNEATEEQVYEFADHIEAFEIADEEDDFVVYIPFEKLGAVGQYTKEVVPASVISCYKAQTSIDVNSTTAESVNNLIDLLENLDDVDSVYANSTINL